MKLLPVLRIGSLAIVAAVSVANVVYNAEQMPPMRAGMPSAIGPVLRQDLRFASARRALSARKITGTIGFLSDLPAGRTTDDDHAAEDYYLAQFSLAPVVLDANSEPYDWAIASFRTVPTEKRISGGWQIAEDLGDGVFLLRKAGK